MDAKDGSLIQDFDLRSGDHSIRQGGGPGLIFSHDGRNIYLATANKNSVLVFDWDASVSKLKLNRQIDLPSGSFAQTVAISPDDKTLYVAAGFKNKLLAVDIASGNTAQASVGSYPYGVGLSADGHTAYVTNQAESTISILSVDGLTLTPQNKLTVGTHPNSMLLDAKRNWLYVANGDSDTISIVNTVSNTVVNTISLAPYPDAPNGSSPTNMTLSPDGGTLYVANSGNNDVAVVDVSDKGEFGRTKGLIPTGWYPTGVQVAPGGQLLITSAKGLGTGPNVGKDPANPQNGPYITLMLQGYLSVVPAPSESQLATYTRMVRENNGFDDKGKAKGFDKHFNAPGTIVPRHPGEGSPIKHIIYIVKENRTYDQVLGDLGKGNGDPSLTLFGWNVTPNQHKLAQQFVTLDNFYADGEVSQDGWDWATEANSNPFNQYLTHQYYGGTGGGYDSSGYLDSQVTAGNADPSRAFLWDAAAAAGMTFRHYGMHSLPSDWFGPNNEVKCPAGKYCTFEKLLNDNTDHDYPWFDMGITDMARYQEWNKEFQQYVANDNLPTFQFIDLPRDHSAGGGTALALATDNDQALGKIVETVSHSKYWKDTAIFVVEDDAQGGVDHVDAHRTIAQVISPYTQRGIIDSHFYSQVSMLRTMELLVGLGPLTQFDAAALPMIYSFGDKPNFAGYDAVMAPTVSATVSSPIVNSGQTVTVTGTVNNSAGSPLSGTTLHLVAPNGWTVTPGDIPMKEIPSGGSASASWTVTVPMSVSSGRQQFTVQANYPLIGNFTGSNTGSISVTVNGAPVQIPGKVEAEDYLDMSGIQTENCSEGGQDVGYLDPGDWMDYTIKVPSSGTYKVNYRVAVNSSTPGSVNFLLDGVSKKITSLPSTGGWQNWATVSDQVDLTEGIHTVRLQVAQSGWNLNWFELANVAEAGSQTAGLAQPTEPSSTQLAVSVQSVMKPENMVGQPDQVDPQKLNEEIWRAIKGPNVPMPAPKHNFYTSGNAAGKDSDDLSGAGSAARKQLARTIESWNQGTVNN
ncbi:carbohydrate-binding protein [Paenibacillus filicis]|uniref:Carbohydrate-binding protein n=1 Tax=Paenibacillus gyeongsangnamensis TaxID=3388067 RepID=A0ABT4QI73_9BACL|nr:carbohydrate-binding protein [Paenibacillus filicis]MCZ8516582.1 carbohydrate-binding protein [Paenibacillus filicis]